MIEYKLVWQLPESVQQLQGYFNDLAARGWRYVGFLPMAAGTVSVLIFIREKE